MGKKLKIIIFVSVVILVLVSIILSIKINNKISNEKNQYQNEEKINSIAPNENIKNVEIDNTITNNNTNITSEPKYKISSEEEQAKELVKKDWGEDDSVYFSTEGKNTQGEYIIGVRSKENTYIKCWYYVDLENSTFEIVK